MYNQFNYQIQSKSYKETTGIKTNKKTKRDKRADYCNTFKEYKVIRYYFYRLTAFLNMHL